MGVLCFYFQLNKGLSLIIRKERDNLDVPSETEV